MQSGRPTAQIERYLMSPDEHGAEVQRAMQSGRLADRIVYVVKFLNALRPLEVGLRDESLARNPQNYNSMRWITRLVRR